MFTCIKVKNAVALLWKLQRLFCFNVVAANKNSTSLTCFHGVWPPTERRDFEQHMRIVPDFISEAEEKQLHEEIEPYMSRLRYEFDHWDDVSTGHAAFSRCKHNWVSCRPYMALGRLSAKNGIPRTGSSWSACVRWPSMAKLCPTCTFWI